MSAKAMRIVPDFVRDEETPQERMCREIHEQRTGPHVPHGEGEIDNRPLARILPVDDILKNSFRLTDLERGK